MVTLSFDAHKAVKALRDAGFDASQAEAVTEQIGIAIGDNLATKDGLLRVRDDLRAGMKSLRADMEKLELRMTNKLYAAVAAGVGLVKALDFLIG